VQKTDSLAAHLVCFCGSGLSHNVGRNRNDRIEHRVEALDSPQVCCDNFNGRYRARLNQGSEFGCRFCC
jgi:hypothetical protein